MKYVFLFVIMFLSVLSISTYAWYGASPYRCKIIANSTSSMPILVKNTTAFNVFALQANDSYVYSSDTSCNGVDAIADDSSQKNWYFSNNQSGNNPYGVWDADIIARVGFDETSGNTTYDMSAQKQNFTITNTSMRVNGLFGQMIEINGISAQGANSTKYSLYNMTSNSFTWIVWVKPNALNDWEIIADMGSETKGSNGRVAIYLNTTGGVLCRLKETLADGDTGIETGNYILSVGKWYMIGLVRNESDDKLYCFVNGNYISNTSISSIGSINNIYNIKLGMNGETGTQAFKGYIDEFYFYNRSLTLSELNNVYYQGIANFSRLGAYESSSGDDTTSPTYSIYSSNVTNATNINTGTPILVYARWNDNNVTDKYMISNKTNSSTWVNGTWQNFAAGNWTNFTITYPTNALGGSFSVRIYANDTMGNQNVTGIIYWNNNTYSAPHATLYCKNVQLNNTQNSNILYNYTVFVNLTNTTGIDASRADIYFTNVSCEESGTISNFGNYRINNTYEAVFINDSVGIPANSYRNISMHYGNSSSVSDTSNIKEAYLFGEDWQSYDTGTVVNITYANITSTLGGIWRNHSLGTGGEIGNDPRYCNVSLITDAGNNRVIDLHILNDGSSNNPPCGLLTVQNYSITPGYVFESYWKPTVLQTTQDALEVFTGNDTNGWISYSLQYNPFYSSTRWHFSYNNNNDGNAGSSAVWPVQNVWGKLTQYFNTSGLTAYWNNTLIGGCYTAATVLMPMHIQFYLAWQDKAEMRWRVDNITFRNYSLPEPTTWMVEEGGGSPPAPPPTGSGLSNNYTKIVNSNGQSKFNITFNGSQNSTFYINLPKNATVSNAKLNVSGYETDNIGIWYNQPGGVATGDVTKSKLAFRFNTTSDTKINKLRMDTFGSASYTTTLYLYSDLSGLPSSSLVSCSYLNPATKECSISNYTLIANTNYWIVSTSDDPQGTELNCQYIGIYNNTTTKGWNGGSWVDNFMTPWGCDIGYYYNNTITNPYLDIANDGDTQWNYTGSYSSQEQTNDFSSELNTYLKSCIPYIDGTCDIPITAHSDSAGIMEIDLNNTITYTTQSYDETVYVGQDSEFWIKVNATEDISSVSGYLVYNGTSYSTTGSNATSFWTFDKTLTIPSSSGTQNVSFYWNFSYINSTGTFYQNFSSYQQTIISSSLTDCTSGNIALNFTTWDEENPSSQLFYDMDINMTYYISGNPKTYYHNFRGNNSYQLCINSSSDINAYAVIDYWNDSFGYTRHYYLDNFLIFNDTMQNIRLYLLNSSIASEVSLTIDNVNMQPIGNAKIDIMRNINGSYVTISQGKTTDDGMFTFHLNPQIIYYIVITASGYGTKTTNLQPTLSTYTIFLPGEAAPVPAYWEAYNGWTSSCVFDNTTPSITCQYADVSGHLTNTTLLVKSLDITTGQTIICQNTSSISSATFRCVLPSISNKTYAYTLQAAYSSIPTLLIMESGTITLYNLFKWGLLGVFLSFVITMTIGFVTLQFGRPSYVVFGTLLSIIFCFFMGFIGPTESIVGAIIGLTFAGVIIMVKSWA